MSDHDDSQDFELVQEPDPEPRPQAAAAAEQRPEPPSAYPGGQPQQPQQQQVVVPQKKSGCRNCCLFGCLFAIILGLGGTAAVFLGAPYLGKVLLATYTDAEPADLPEVEVSDEEMDRINQKVEAFQTTLQKRDTLGILTLTSRDLNALIARNPKWQAQAGKVYVTIEGDKITGQISVPFDELAKGDPQAQRNLEKLGLQGRYLNASASIKVALRNGLLSVTLDRITVKGKPVPEFLMRELRKHNLAEDMPAKDPDAAEALRKLESVDVRDGLLIIKSKAGGQDAPGAPPMR